MKRILALSLALGLVVGLLSGCEAFKKKNTEESDSKMAIQEIKPDSDANAAQPTEEPAPEGAPAGGRTHVVQKGDTLFKLARQYYNNDQSQWRRIWQANQAQVPDPNVLKVGQQLVIP